MAANLKKMIGHNMAKQTLLITSPKGTVRDCVEQLYKSQVEKGLVKGLVSGEWPENQVLIKKLSNAGKPKILSARKRLTPRKSRSGLMHRIIKNSTKLSDNYLTTSKKLHRMRAIKVYGRPFATSATSSVSSLNKQNEQRRQPGRAQNLAFYLKRLELNMPGERFGIKDRPAARNQSMHSRTGLKVNAESVSAIIQKDLLPVDQETKSLISVVKIDEEQLKKESDPLRGWNHPRLPENLSSEEVDRTDTQAELEAHYRRLKLLNQQKQFERLHYTPDIDAAKLGLNTVPKLGRDALNDALIRSNREKRARIAQYAKDKDDANKSAAERVVHFTNVSPIAAKQHPQRPSTNTLTPKPSNNKTSGRISKAKVARAGSVASALGAKAKTKKISKNVTGQKERIHALPNRPKPTPTSIVCATILKSASPVITSTNRYNQFSRSKKF